MFFYIIIIYIYIYTVRYTYIWSDPHGHMATSPVRFLELYLCYHIYIYYSHYKFIHALAGLIKSPVPRFGKAAVAAMTCKDGHI